MTKITKIQRLILENQRIIMNVLRPVAERFEKEAWANDLYKQVIKTREILKD